MALSEVSNKQLPGRLLFPDWLMGTVVMQREAALCAAGCLGGTFVLANRERPVTPAILLISCLEHPKRLPAERPVMDDLFCRLIGRRACSKNRLLKQSNTWKWSMLHSFGGYCNYILFLTDLLSLRLLDATNCPGFQSSEMRAPRQSFFLGFISVPGCPSTSPSVGDAVVKRPIHILELSGM